MLRWLYFILCLLATPALADGGISNSQTITLPLTVTNGGTGGVSPGQPYFMAAMKSANQSVSTTVATTVLFDTDVIDSGSYYATGTGKFIPLIAGTYSVSSCVTVAATWTLGSSNIVLFLLKNAAIVSAAQTSAATGTDTYSSCASAIVALNGSTDFLITQVNLTGSSTNVVGNANSPSWFHATRIGP